MNEMKAWEGCPTPIWLELIAERWDQGGARLYNRAVMLALDEIAAERERQRYPLYSTWCSEHMEPFCPRHAHG